MKINLDQQFLDLHGSPLPQTMADVLADELAGSGIGDPVKMHNWAVKLVNEGEIEVNKDDMTFLIGFIRRSRLNNLAKAQLIEKLKMAEENSQGVTPAETGCQDDFMEKIDRDIKRKIINLG